MRTETPGTSDIKSDTRQTGHKIHQHRLQAGITLTALANALDVAPTRISTFERGIIFNNDLAYRARDWLTQVTA